MGVMIQIRNVPSELHRTLKARAAAAGMSLSDYLLGEIRQVADQPSMEELRERLHKLPKLDLSPSPAEVIRELRDQS